MVITTAAQSSKLEKKQAMEEENEPENQNQQTQSEAEINLQSDVV